LTEAQALSAWTPPTGTLGELTDEARARAATLRSRKSELERRASSAPLAAGFAAALKGAKVSLIAELKRSSPSKGVINADIQVESQLRAYERGGASAASILTEPTRFSGSSDDLVRARATVGIPLLKKDFHIDPLQIVEARALGASAALVIARAVNPKQARELFKAARDIGIEILMEVRTEAELDFALSLDAEVVGVNNRNLETLEIDPETTARLIPLIPARLIAVAESGVRSVDDVRRMADAGADAVLVGSAISASADPEAAVRSLAGVARRSNDRKD
jgi:indole-3-glycerol phosphate synthase